MNEKDFVRRTRGETPRLPLAGARIPRVFLIGSIVVVLAMAVFAGKASAANWPDSSLDTAASSVAGHPVNVWCEASWADWIHAGDTAGEDWGLLIGFTDPSVPTIYLQPTVCETLHVLVKRGPEQVGPYWGSLAIHALVHESKHQAGYLDEGQTDCAALAVDDQVAVQFFGYKKTDRVTSWVKTRRHGRTVYAKKISTVPSRQLALFHAWDHAWHAASPPEYQGGCT
jgi:hypothetical protein